MLPLKKEIQIHESIKQKKEHRKIGRFRKKIKNGKIYEYDTKTKVLTELNLGESDLKNYDPKNRQYLDQYKRVVKKSCMYVEAINFKNALKKLEKGKFILIT